MESYSCGTPPPPHKFRVVKGLMTISKSYLSLSHFLAMVFILTLPWAAVAQIVNTGTINRSGLNNYGIFSSGTDDITNAASGVIRTEGMDAHGIASTGTGDITNAAGGMISTAGSGATGIALFGSSGTITNAGTITTEEREGHGIFSTGTSDITNAAGGVISTAGFRADGILSTGTGDISNNSTITSSGRGIHSRGNTDTIINTGTIRSGREGIRSQGDDTTITNDGTITTTGNGSSGISSSGDGDVINDGTITTTVGNARGILKTGTGNITNAGTINSAGSGIFSSGDGTTITNTNDGAITTAGISADGIRSQGDDTTITNDGTITMTGEDANGIFSNGANVRIINNGTIAMTGSMTPGTISRARGIFSSGSNATITNNGIITATENDVDGIRSSRVDTAITNDGTITMTGDNAHGINSSGDDTTITNTNDGTITMNGNFVSGIQSTGDDADITIDGTITTGGRRAHGIRSSGERAEITIGGTVTVSGGESFVVHGGDDTDQTLNLLAGAKTQGEFNLGDSEGDNDVANVWVDTTTSTSSTVAIGGAETINLMSADPNARIFQLPRLESSSGDSVAMVDPTGSSATRVILGAITGQIQRQVFRRLDSFPASASMEEGSGWATFFGIPPSERSEDGLALAWEHNLYGVSGGYDALLDSGQRVGLFGGVSKDRMKTSEVTSIEDSATHIFVGVYGRQSMGSRLSLDGSVLFGYANHDSDRAVRDNVAGYEVAGGEYNSFYISPSLALGWSHELESGLEFRPSAQVSYTYGYYDDYTESGTTNSNISFDDRSVNIFDGRLELALARSFSDAQGEIELRGGATLTHYGEDSVGARLGDGPSISYRVPGDETTPGSYAGINLRYKVADYASIDADVEYIRTLSRSSAVLAQIGLAVRF